MSTTKWGVMLEFGVARTKSLLLVGMGSIGATHLIKASREFSTITVFDIDSSKELKVLELGNSLSVEITFVKSLAELGHDSFFDLIVLANWGPDHVKTYMQISGFSNNFLIEKPLASKVRDLIFLQQEVEAGKIILANLQWNYSGFAQRIFELQSLYNLGDLCGLQLFGGAKCLVTNGIHYLSLASNLLGEYPNSVAAMINSTHINPRREDFQYYDGFSGWSYDSGRFLSMHLQNNSQISETFRVIFQNGLIEVRKGKMSALAIPFEDRKLLLHPARTLHPSQTSEFKEAFTLENGQDGLDIIYEGFSNHTHKAKDFESGYQATLGIIASLFSSELGTSINIRNLTSIDNYVIDKDWNIT
jgi:predicted dehydrogenase